MLEIFTLHEHPEFLNECADVLNEEWPRSKTARLHSLEKSRAELPCGLVLVQTNGTQQTVIGHCRLSKVQEFENACFIESVVIRKSMRGEGLGRKLMDMAEKEAQRFGFDDFYLTTHDKQEFYKHIGYDFCQPVTVFGMASTIMGEEKLKKMFSNLSTGNSNKLKSKDQRMTKDPTLSLQSASLKQDKSFQSHMHLQDSNCEYQENGQLPAHPPLVSPTLSTPGGTSASLSPAPGGTSASLSSAPGGTSASLSSAPGGASASLSPAPGGTSTSLSPAPGGTSASLSPALGGASASLSQALDDASAPPPPPPPALRICSEKFKSPAGKLTWMRKEACPA